MLVREIGGVDPRRRSVLSALRSAALGFSTLLLVVACASNPSVETPAASAPVAVAAVAGTTPLLPAPVLSLNDIGVGYMKLVLAVGAHDADYVDAYYGPADLKAEVAQHPLTLPQIEEQAQELIAALADVDDAAEHTEANLLALRKSYLKNQLGSLTARARLLQGEKMSFDDEARALYDVEPPHYNERDFEPVLQIMDGLLPKGPGTLAQRYNQYIEQFAVPAARLETVMRTAIGIAQYRSASHLTLPPGERFDLAFVSGKPWSAYNWYQGNYSSRIEVNTELPIPVSRVIELAAHEGYPGHHVYNGLLEQKLVRGRGWPEYQIYALFSPQSFIAEGSADYGVGMVFPGNEMLEFTRELFQLAGFDPRAAANYLEVVEAAKALAPSTIEGARRYLDGEISSDGLLAWLQKYTLASPARAQQRLSFIQRYRSYIINYSFGEELVRAYVEREGDKTLASPAQWRAFGALLSSPHTPTSLLGAPAAMPIVPSTQESTSIVISAPGAENADRLQPATPAPTNSNPAYAPSAPSPNRDMTAPGPNAGSAQLLGSLPLPTPAAPIATPQLPSNVGSTQALPSTPIAPFAPSSVPPAPAPIPVPAPTPAPVAMPVPAPMTVPVPAPPPASASSSAAVAAPTATAAPATAAAPSSPAPQSAAASMSATPAPAATPGPTPSLPPPGPSIPTAPTIPTLIPELEGRAVPAPTVVLPSNGSSSTPSSTAATNPAPPSVSLAPTATLPDNVPWLARQPVFQQFIAKRPTPEQFRSRFPKVLLVLPGMITTKEFRFDSSRYFADLDAQGRIIGGRFH